MLAVLVSISPTLLHAANTSHNEGDSFFSHSIHRLSQLSGFQCRFDQFIAFSDGGGQHYSGEVAMRKPKRFRWLYQQPYEQLYVGDGSAIWHYEPELMQAEHLNDLDQVAPAVMKLLDGRITLKDIDILGYDGSSESGLKRYQVHIDGASEVWLGFNEKGELASIERSDLLGNRNRMLLSECSYIAPSKNLFSFVPPKGVDIVDLRNLMQQKDL